MDIEEKNLIMVTEVSIPFRRKYNFRLITNPQVLTYEPPCMKAVI